MCVCERANTGFSSIPSSVWINTSVASYCGIRSSQHCVRACMQVLRTVQLRQWNGSNADVLVHVRQCVYGGWPYTPFQRERERETENIRTRNGVRLNDRDGRRGDWLNSSIWTCRWIFWSFYQHTRITGRNTKLYNSIYKQYSCTWSKTQGIHVNVNPYSTVPRAVNNQATDENKYAASSSISEAAHKHNNVIHKQHLCSQWKWWFGEESHQNIVSFSLHCVRLAHCARLSVSLRFISTLCMSFPLFCP